MSELPPDILKLTLKYPGWCRITGEELLVGDEAFWSRSRHRVYSQEAVRYVRAHEKFVASPAGERGGVVPPVPPAEENGEGANFQRRWQRLCTYLRQSILGEAAQSLVPYEHQNRWFLQVGGAAELVIGGEDDVEAPESLQQVLAEQEDRRSFIYGWPTIVAPGFDGSLHVAPMFVVPVYPLEPEEGGGHWRLHARREAEFNPALLAGELFPQELSIEVDAEIGDSLPSGQPSRLVGLAERLAELMDLPAEDLDPFDLVTDIPPEAAVHNAVTIVYTEGFGASNTLQQELVRMASRRDWRQTGAAHLLLEGFEPSAEPAGIRELLAGPLKVNASQEKVLEMVRSTPLTVVTGPPGTGKSELVVNIAANAWLDGETVLIASTNNAAVDVATDRAVEAVAQALVIRTGNRSHAELVPELISSAVVQAETFEANEPTRQAELELVARQRQVLLRALGELGPAEETVLENSESVEKCAVGLWDRAPAPALPLEVRIVQRRAERLTRARWFVKWRTRWLFRRLGCSSEGRSLELLVEWTVETQRRPVLVAELERLELIVGDPALSVTEADVKWQQASLGAVRARIAVSVDNGSNQLGSFGAAAPNFDRLKGLIHHSLAVLPGWSCTAMSMKRNFKIEAGLFDLVVVDEASQCTLATVMPLAYRAKRLVVVGDPNQLSPIISVGDGHLEMIAQISGLDDAQLADQGIHHKKGSAFAAFEHAAYRDDGRNGRNSEVAFLNEHYRCHPIIARWFNEAFYNDSLHVLTDISAMTTEARGLFWQDVEGVARRPPMRAKSWINEDEARAAVDIINDTVRQGGLTIGVVTPFAAQARYINELAVEEVPGGRETLDEAEFISGSAYRLQGNEKDVVIFSPVLAPGISDHGTAWVERQREMVNVAVSRARQLLVIVGHPEMELWGGPTLTSLRDYARSVAENPELPRYRIDSESERRLLSAMREAGLVPQAKILSGGFELDFAIQGPAGWLDVEVDGDQHVDDRGQQIREDVVRDRILRAEGWEVLRIKAWRCWSDLNNVIDEIKRGLKPDDGPIGRWEPYDEPSTLSGSAQANIERNHPGLFTNHPRGYSAWSQSEDEYLTELHEAGVTVDDISSLLSRHPGAIRSRLGKLGLS